MSRSQLVYKSLIAPLIPRISHRYQYCTVHVRTAPRVVRSLNFSRRISNETLRRPNERIALIVGLAGGTAAHELFLVVLLETMWCARSTCAPTDSLRTTRTERRATSMWRTWRTAPSRTHCSSPRGAEATRTTASARSPAQTTVGLCVTKCNSRGKW